MSDDMKEMEDACLEAKVVKDISQVVWLETDSRKTTLHARRGYKPVELEGEPVVVEELQLYTK